MQPPICSFCHRDQRDCEGLEFGLVKFADYEPLDRPGHPKGMLWFCNEHLEEAKKLEQLESSNALKQLRSLLP